MRRNFLFFFLCTGLISFAQNSGRIAIDSTIYRTIRVKPSETSTALHTWDTAHAIFYDAAIKKNKLLLFLAGTNGTPQVVPVDFLNTALSQGYRVIALSYITVPGISQVCIGDALNNNIDCAADFRRKRIYGDNDFSLIKDEPQDAIVPRLMNLLDWLDKNDVNGNWKQYLDTKNNKLLWNKIAVAGQSQGGGMAEFLGQHETLAKVISFSGGWDYSNSVDKKIALWYSNKAVTPLKNWYVTYHINENAANLLKEICTTLKVPEEQVFALNKPLMNADAANERSNPYHGEGIRNTEYRTMWLTMLGSGKEY